MSSLPDLSGSLAELVALELDPAHWTALAEVAVWMGGMGLLMLTSQLGYLYAGWRLRRRSRRGSLLRSYALDLLLPIAIARDAQASLEEVMPIWIATWGHRRARRIRRVQVFLIIAGHYALPVVALVERVLKTVSGRRSAD